MKSPDQDQIAGSSGSGEFEETLRLIARLAAPQGLEKRVQAGLLAAPASGGARILQWPMALRTDTALYTAWLRSAAAAAIVALVIGGSWGVYSRVRLIQPTRAITVPLHLSTQGGFSSAGAMRTPLTLNGPIVERPAAAHPATAEPLPHAGKNAAANKAIVHPAATPAK
jgi:hypothetical protein